MEETQNNETAQDVDTTVDYIQALNELKRNSVDRSKYDQLRAENKRLLESVISGSTPETAQAQPATVDIDELRKDLFKDEPTSNLDYCTKALKLRSAIIESGQADPFLPYGSKITPTTEDVECANRVAAVMQECVDYAEGDDQLFTNELQRRTLDTGRPHRKK